MDRRNLRSVLRHAAAIAGREPAVADRDLLRRFAEERDEVAFAELVRRYGRLVWAVCRHLLPADADAEDAFQATFLALVRSAGSVKDGAKLGPWLHGVAVRVCSNARRAASRRKRREQSASEAEAGRAVPDSAWDAALAAVHEEVARLPESQRVAFVLCCLEGKGTSDAARQLGWKLGTLSGRLTRAKQTLLARLEARGLAATTVAAVAVAGGAASAGVPTVMLDRAVDLIQPGFTIPSSILHLSQGVVGMTVHRTKLLAAVLLLGSGLASMVGTGFLAEAAAQQSKPRSAEAAKQADDLAKQLDDVKRAIETLRQKETEFDKLRAREAEALAQLATARLEKPASKWEYDFVLASEMGTTKFVAFLNDREQRGWEFISQVTLLHDGKDAPHWIFRRPVGAAVDSKLKQHVIEQLDKQAVEKARVLEHLRAMEDKKKAIEQEKPKPGDPGAKPGLQKLKADKEAALADAVKLAQSRTQVDPRVKALMADIAKLSAEIEKLKAAGKPSAEKEKLLLDEWQKLADRKRAAADEAKKLGDKLEFRDANARMVMEMQLGKSKRFTSQELVDLLQKAAVGQFGKEGAPTFELDAKSQIVVIRGTAKAVQWASELAARLTKE